jgi:arsenite methyltransferase
LREEQWAHVAQHSVQPYEDVFSFLNLQYNDDSYSTGHAQFVRNFVGSKEDVSASDLIEWQNEFERLNDAGRYFFSSNRYIFKASKRAS